MLKFREIIRRMTLEQKVSVVTSKTFLETVGLDEYDIPKLNIVKSNREIPLKVLAQTWNEELIEHMAYVFGEEENSRFSASDLYSVPCCYNSWVDSFTEDPYLAGKFVGAYGKGLHEGGLSIAFAKAPSMNDLSLRYYREEELLPIEIAMKSCNPEAIIASNNASLETIKSKFEYTNALLVENDCEDVAVSFVAGADFVFDETNDAAKELFDAVVKHKHAKSKLRSGEFDIDEFNEYCVNNNAIDEKVLDEKINTYLELIKNTKPNRVSVKHVFTSDQITSMNEKVASESIVLLKNNGLLPVERKKKVVLIGNYAKKNLTFDMIPDYVNYTIGYAHGYMGDESDSKLVDLAVELGKNADMALVYLEAKDDKIPENQLELIDALAANGVKIVAVLSSEYAVDMSFEEKCESVILSKKVLDLEAKSVLDIIFGLVNPCGKLTETITSDKEGYNYKAYDSLDKKVIFPFGHGLNYSLFKYSNLEVNEKGVTLTVSNVSDVPGYEVVQLYVGKEKSDLSRNKKDFRGYSRVFIEPGDSLKVCIPFDEYTFAYYSENKGTWDIEDGEYQIYIGSSVSDIKIEATFEILLNNNLAQNEAIDQELDEVESVKRFTYSESKKAFIEEHSRLPFSKRLLFTILFLLAFDPVLIVTLFINYSNADSYILHIILLALLAIINISAIIYLIVSFVKRGPKIKIGANDELSKMITNVSEFKELAKITYEIPVEEEEVEEEIVEEEVIEEEVVEEVTEEPTEEVVESLEEDEEVEAVYNYANTISYETVDEKRTIKKVDFERLCDRLCRFANSKGIIVDPKSTRLLLGSMAAGQLVVVDSPAKNLVVPFLNIVGEFFGDEVFSFDTEKCSDFHSTLWSLNEETGLYEQTDVSKVITKAFAIKKTMHTCTLTNVKYDSFRECFAKILAWANNPSSNPKIKINDNQIYSLGKNLWFFITSDEELPLDIASCVMNITVSLREAEEIIEFTSQTGITYPDFVLNLSAAKDLYYISEENWKRIDEFFEHINETEKFKLGNKQVLQMESFTSTYMAANALEDEALDMVFIAKLVPMLKHSATYKEERGEIKLVEFINRSFGSEEALIQTQKLLKSKINY